jgi:hypothetical protein
VFVLISGVFSEIGIDSSGAVSDREIIVAGGENGILGFAVHLMVYFYPEPWL